MKTYATLNGLLLVGAIVASSAIAAASGETSYNTPQKCQEAGGAVVQGPGPARKTWCRQANRLGSSEYHLVSGPEAGERDSRDQAPSAADLAAERRALESAERNANMPVASPTSGQKRSLSPREQLVETQRRLERVRGYSVLIRRMLESARRRRDLVVTACLSDKLSQINVAARAAGTRADALRDAVARNDAEAMSREFTAVSLVAQRSEDIDIEARQCTGVDLVGESTVRVTVDPKTAPSEPSYPTRVTLP